MREKILVSDNSYFGKCRAFLRQDHIFHFARGESLTLVANEEELEKCVVEVLSIMKRWVVALRHGLIAEFPEFEIIQQFACFHVRRQNTRKVSQ